MDSRYYEGVLQLRNPSKEAVKRIGELIRKRENVWIAKEEKVEGGIDFYISSWRCLLAIGKRLQKEFGGEIKISRRIWSINKLTSKNIYRVVVLLRLPKFKKGSIIEYKGKKIRVTGFRKRISAVDTETGKRVFIKYKEV
ncbi:MAG: NMD3-related protein [Candidatus Pacearchaeota archaeon]